MDWLIQTGEVSDRVQGVLLGRELLDQSIIKHGKYLLRTVIIVCNVEVLN